MKNTLTQSAQFSRYPLFAMCLFKTSDKTRFIYEKQNKSIGMRIATPFKPTSKHCWISREINMTPNLAIINQLFYIRINKINFVYLMHFEYNSNRYSLLFINGIFYPLFDTFTDNSVCRKKQFLQFMQSA